MDPGFRRRPCASGCLSAPVLAVPELTNPVDNFNREVVDGSRKSRAWSLSGMTNGLAGVGILGRQQASPSRECRRQAGSCSSPSSRRLRRLLSGDEYAAARRARLQHGRPCEHTPVVIVNETMAKNEWPGQRAIGKRMHAGNPKRPYPWATVVGVVADTKVEGPDQPSKDQFYFAAQQADALYGAAAAGSRNVAANGYITLRSTLPPEQMVAGAARGRRRGRSAAAAASEMQPMDEVISNVEAPRRFNTDLITAFAVGALLLAITGIYAVVAFSVSLRTQEIAIRMALGAQRSGIARLVLVSGAKLALLGCGLGLVGSLAVSRVVSAFLFGVSATDPLVFAGAVVAMMLLALLASALPASRAASGDPIDALRSS